MKNELEFCKMCGKEDNLQRHHITYIPEEVVCLCKECHKRTHSKEQSKYHVKQDPNGLFYIPRGIPEKASVTVKRINDNSYFYFNWRDGEQIKSEYICSVENAEEHELYKDTKEEDTMSLFDY